MPTSAIRCCLRSATCRSSPRTASGTQNYACNATATGFAWTFTGPRANLYDLRGRVIITHFGGPTWQANDGSKVVGTLSGTQTVDPNSIPWLLLSGKATPAPNGGGLLANTTFIQRLLTRGGLAPAASTCNAKTVGSTAAVPYTAEYVFWKSTPHQLEERSAPRLLDGGAPAAPRSAQSSFTWVAAPGSAGEARRRAHAFTRLVTARCRLPARSRARSWTV